MVEEERKEESRDDLSTQPATPILLSYHHQQTRKHLCNITEIYLTIWVSWPDLYKADLGL